MYVEKFRGGDLDKGELLQLYIYGIFIYIYIYNPYFHSSTVVHVFQTSSMKIYDELKLKRIPFF